MTLEFYDAHSHRVEDQAGGLLIGLEGEPVVPGAVTNADALAAAVGNPNIIPVQYVSRGFAPSDALALKYHARREGYTVEEVIADLKTRPAKLVVIDTLNEPYWDFRDYWRVVDAFKDKQFVLAHCGGFDIPNFVKIVMSAKNVWTDFSFTQTYFGFTGEATRYPLVCDCIQYCLDHPKISERILFGSDNPYVSQRNAVDCYARLPGAEAFLGGNIAKLFNEVR